MCKLPLIIICLFIVYKSVLCLIIVCESLIILLRFIMIRYYYNFYYDCQSILSCFWINTCTHPEILITGMRFIIFAKSVPNSSCTCNGRLTLYCMCYSIMLIPATTMYMNNEKLDHVYIPSSSDSGKIITLLHALSL